ncbi:MAG: class I SAM-dependent methyltransferase [Ardenticatenaceae bacterium]|nr:class I SAM-dependent methyltransferase [Ardenticatenaceae bacterium]
MPPQQHTASTELRASDLREGSVDAFRANWSQRPESNRYHFKRGQPENQIQFAFQNHWRVFKQILGNRRSGYVLEVGCGRGSMGAFFAEDGFEVHLLDTSEAALQIAQLNFAADGLQGYAVCGDTLALPYRGGVFDVVISIGLLEHFADITQPIYEQLRVLQPGGLFLGYVVPERPLSVQTFAIPVNFLLRMGHTIHQTVKPVSKAGAPPSKAPLYRNTFAAADYLTVLQAAGVQEKGSFGMFPVPLISHSPGFPFSLMSPLLERGLVWVWQRVLAMRIGANDQWICPECWGLAFLVWAWK